LDYIVIIKIFPAIGCRLRRNKKGGARKRLKKNGGENFWVFVLRKAESPPAVAEAMARQAGELGSGVKSRRQDFL
jgi:hypothetical protein